VFEVVSIESIERKAQAAAQVQSCAKTASTYPQDSTADAIFRASFAQARAAIEHAQRTTETS
jgi:hypothetical protein